MTNSHAAKPSSNACCRLCKSANIKRVLYIQNMPNNIQILMRENQIRRTKPVDVSVYLCGVCGLAQLIDVLPMDYYESYIMSTSYSRATQDLQKRQAQTLADAYGLRGKRVLEAGCGDGSFMEHLRDQGMEVTGVEPSEPFRRLAIERGFIVEPGYISPGRAIKGHPFDGFATRQVLEHIPDIMGFLLGIRENCRPGAIGLIEVPRLEKALDDHRFYDFFPDHLNYFSIRTLQAAALMAGFEIVSAFDDMNGEYNVAIVKVPEKDNFENLEIGLDTLKNKFNALISSELGRGRRVAIWGAGGKGLSIMAAVGLSGISYVVDSDANKHNLYTPVSHLPIYPPRQLLDDPVDTLILTALAFKKEILDQVRNEIGFTGKIIVIGEAPL